MNSTQIARTSFLLLSPSLPQSPHLSLMNLVTITKKVGPESREEGKREIQFVVSQSQLHKAKYGRLSLKYRWMHCRYFKYLVLSVQQDLHVKCPQSQRVYFEECVNCQGFLEELALCTLTCNVIASWSPKFIYKPRVQVL